MWFGPVSFLLKCIIFLLPPAVLALSAHWRTRVTIGSTRTAYWLLAAFGTLAFLFNIWVILLPQDYVPAPQALYEWRYLVGTSLILLTVPLWFLVKIAFPQERIYRRVQPLSRAKRTS